MGTAMAQWLRCYATNRKVAGSIPSRVIGEFVIDLKSFGSHYGPGVDSVSISDECQKRFPPSWRDWGKQRKVAFWVTDVPAKLRTGYCPNTSQKLRHWWSVRVGCLLRRVLWPTVAKLGHTIDAWLPTYDFLSYTTVMCTVLLPQGVNPVAGKYVISYLFLL